MKLKLEHLAPYLPYKLSMQYYENKRIGILQSVSTDTLGQPYSIKVHGVFWNNFVYKPILRPLSDITKEIEHNGEKFVPINEIGFKDNYDLAIELFFKAELEELPVRIFKKLLEWHFDVFGLIEQNLAIDINSLKK